MNYQPFISVIIPTYNRENFLIDLLKDLAKQNYPNFEVIIIDQSEEVSLKLGEVISSLGIKIKYLKIQHKGASRARNIGLRDSKGDLIIFLDDDTVIPENSFLTEHAKCYNDSKIGGVSGKVIEKNKKSTFGKIGKVFPVICLPGGKADGEKFTFVDTVKGMNMSFRRDLLERIGGFDERFGAPSIYEETDVSLKIRRMGYKILFNPNATVIHLSASRGGQRQAKSEADFRFIAFRDRVLLFKNNYSIWLSPFFLLGNLALAFRPIIKLKWELVNSALRGLIEGIKQYLL